MTTSSSTSPAVTGDAAASAPKKATETLSQFVARVLDQLALSAWLPAAALVLLLGFIGALGAEADEAGGGVPTEIVGETLDRMAGVSLGGAALGFFAVIVLTMLTQAFAYEAIQALEGYWGASRAARSITARRCKRHRGKRKRLVRIERQLRVQAWQTCQRKLRRREARRAKKGLPPILTDDMIRALRAAVFSQKQPEALTAAERRTATLTPWEDFADAELVRRRHLIQKRLRDYPSSKHVMPTALGNVLRRHEDAMAVREPRTYVIRVYDSLPFNLQVDHDDARNRLDLYCAMVFVLVLAGVVALARLWAHPWYAGSIFAGSLMAAVFSYRAAIASARWYGDLLVTIANRTR